MAYNAGEVVKFTVVQNYDSQVCLNTFYYKMNDPLTAVITPAEFGEIFWDAISPNWLDLVINSVTFERVIVENLDGDLSYGEYVLPALTIGQYTDGQPMAAFAAYAIQLNRTSRLTRHGAKRIVGVSETGVTNFGVVEAGRLAVLQALADDFASDIVYGLPTLCNPVIVGFPNDNRPSRVEVPIDTATAKTVISTQNTRKRGAGS